ncbi:MAG TPA: hypothetical protein DEO33_02550 [Rikenellaceae bacterium]|nr:hypothetical protein [Rikenellaceae bacterium]
MKDSEKLQQLIDVLKMAPSQFAKEIGYDNPQIIYNVLHEKNGISRNLARLISDRFPDVVTFDDLIGDKFVQFKNKGVNIQSTSSTITVSDQKTGKARDEIELLKAENIRLKTLVELLERELDGYRNRESLFMNLIAKNEATKP